VASFLALQIGKLVHFMHHHASECWADGEQPTTRAQVDDPLLALCCRLRLSRPRAREHGAFEAPEDCTAEPQRTELALAEAFNCGLGFRRRIARLCFRRKLGYYARDDRESAGRGLETLQGWLLSGISTRAGILLQVVQVRRRPTAADPHAPYCRSRVRTTATMCTAVHLHSTCARPRARLATRAASPRARPDGCGRWPCSSPSPSTQASYSHTHGAARAARS
jgi:hypothetical protein